MRNIASDIIRAIALLQIILYHSWVLCKNVSPSAPNVPLLISYGGEIGVTCFFVLSGFGIYYSLNKMDNNKSLSFTSFAKKRCIRILPHYYFSLIISVFLLDGAYWLSKENAWAIISHFLFLHTFSPNAQGAVNGVLWTMGVIIHYYIIAIPIYILFKKHPLIVYTTSIITTILLSSLTNYINTQHTFVACRQIWTSLDNFVAGMLIAYFIKYDKLHIKKIVFKISFLLISLSVFFTCIRVRNLMIGKDTLFNTAYFSILSMSISIIILALSQFQINQSNYLVKPLLIVSNYEYGIYIWHLLIINNLITKSPLFVTMLNNGNYKTTYCLLLLISIIIGIIMSKLVDSWSCKQLAHKK